MLSKTILLLSQFIFLLLPWYYTDSGQPQPVDIFIITLLFSFIIMRLPYLKSVFKYAYIYKLFLLFSTYTLVTLTLNYIIDNQEISMILVLRNIYYVLLTTTFLLMMLFHLDHYKQKFHQLIIYLLLIDTLIPLSMLLNFGLTLNTRIALSFNNPNQLGFYALVNFALLFYIILSANKYSISFNRALCIIIMNINLIFIFISASRACYPALILYTLSYPLMYKIKMNGVRKILATLFILIMSFSLILTLCYKLYSHMKNIRMNMLPTSYKGIMDDIYFRALKGIENNLGDTWYFLFGNGNYTNTTRGTLEFHNNFIATMGQIGIFGLLFYIYINIVILRELVKEGLLYTIPYLCYLYYSFFHYSYRTRVNWLLLAIVIFILLFHKLQSKSYMLREAA